MTTHNDRILTAEIAKVDSIAAASLDAQNKAEASFAPVVPTGLARHWILEIHFVDRARAIGGSSSSC
jgi:hypothetical protein